jgi:hypothetical protein
VQAIGRQPRRAPDGAPVHYERHRPEQTTLYRLVQQHAATFFAETEAAAGADLPQFVKDEFDAFLECGILAHGFLKLARAVGNRFGEITPLLNLSRLALQQDDPALALVQAGSALEIAIAVHHPLYECVALGAIGDAELALQHHPAAGAAFERARAVAQAIDHPALYDAAAGSALAALAQGDAAGAMRAVEVVLAYLAGGGTLERPQPTLLACYRVLASVADARAAGVLATAHADLQARAARLGPALRPGS